MAVAVEYLPSVGYLVAINESDRELLQLNDRVPSTNAGAENHNQFLFLYQQQDTVYFKNKEMYGEYFTCYYSCTMAMAMAMLHIHRLNHN